MYPTGGARWRQTVRRWHHPAAGHKQSGSVSCKWERECVSMKCSVHLQTPIPFDSISPYCSGNIFLYSKIFLNLLYVVLPFLPNSFSSVTGIDWCGYDVVSDANEPWLRANFQARRDEGSLSPKQEY